MTAKVSKCKSHFQSNHTILCFEFRAIRIISGTIDEDDDMEQRFRDINKKNRNSGMLFGMSSWDISSKNNIMDYDVQGLGSVKNETSSLTYTEGHNEEGNWSTNRNEQGINISGIEFQEFMSKL